MKTSAECAIEFWNDKRMKAQEANRLQFLVQEREVSNVVMCQTS